MLPQNEIPLGLKLAILWLFTILNMVFRDIHELTMAGTLEEILDGRLNGVVMSEGLLVVGAFAVELVLLGFLGSALLKPRAARRMNLVLPILAILGTIAARPSDPDDYIFAIIEILTFGAIWWMAVKWKTEPAHADLGKAE